MRDPPNQEPRLLSPREHVGQLKKHRDEIKLAYDLRNDAVHDGYFSEKNTRKAGFMDMFLRFIERYLRVGMHNYILLMNQGLSKNEIINRL